MGYGDNNQRRQLSSPTPSRRPSLLAFIQDPNTMQPVLPIDEHGLIAETTRTSWLTPLPYNTTIIVGSKPKHRRCAAVMAFSSSSLMAGTSGRFALAWGAVK